MCALVIHVGGTNRKIRRLGRQIFDVVQKSFILGDVERPTSPSAMKVVDARLQRVSQVEQLAITGSEAAYDRTKPVPEAFDREPRFGQSLVIHEIIKSFRNA